MTPRVQYHATYQLPTPSRDRRAILRLHYADGSTLDLGLDIFADDHPLEKFLAELDPTTRVTGHVVG